MKRNTERFPEDFCFQLNSEEFKNLRFQNATSSPDNYGGRSEFLDYKYAEKYVAIYLSNNLGLKRWMETIGNESTPFVTAFDTGYNTSNWVYIKGIKYDED